VVVLNGLRRLPATFGALSTGRKAILAATGGGAVALAVLLYSWSSSTSLVPLYTRLDPADSAKIVDELRSQGVKFELEGGGATILVPEVNLDELRMNFASQGLPEGGNVGFELFDGNAFTATDFVQRLNFQRGLQGELARSIETFSAVERARVHIVLPERSLFVAEEQPATASVVLELVRGRTLASDEVAGIAHLVSGAVEGLDKEHITVVDTAGRVIFDGSLLAEDAGIGASATHLQMQQEYEQRLEHSVQSMLDRALGAGRSTVQVRAALNFDRSETETESYQPLETNEGIPRSSTSVTETYTTSGDASTGAVPGAIANIPGADASLTAPLPENAATTYQRTESTSNFELGKTIERTQAAPGRLEGLSVSLLLDESVPAEQAADLEQAVGAAVGVDAERGDRIVVSRLAFDKQALEEAEAGLGGSLVDTAVPYVRLALPLVALVLGFVFFRMLLKTVASHGPAYVASEWQPALPGGAAPALPGTAAAALEAATRRQAPALPPPPEENRSEVERQVQSLAQSRPDSVAEVVQAWLREE
jgi:flagellar M-ring protein FliF